MIYKYCCFIDIFITSRDIPFKIMHNIESKIKETFNYRSIGERKIADVLDKYHIDFKYEKPALIQDEHNLQRIWYPDFYLPEFGLYLEYYGLTGNHNYDNSILKKDSAYHKNGLDVIPVYPVNVNNGLSEYIIHNIDYSLMRKQAILKNKTVSYR